MHQVTGDPNKSTTKTKEEQMSINLRFVAPVLAAGAVAVAIAGAPSASAASVRTCADGGGATICQSPGNVEIHPEQPPVQAPRIYGPFSSPIPFLFN
jgi:hypothetical protein